MRCPGWHGLAAQVLENGLRDGVASQQRARDVLRQAQAREAANRAVGVPHDAERLRRLTTTTPRGTDPGPSRGSPRRRRDAPARSPGRRSRSGRRRTARSGSRRGRACPRCSATGRTRRRCAALRASRVHAALRWARCRAGSAACSSALVAARTASWTSRPSAPSSTKGSARRRANRSAGSSSGKHRLQQRSVVRRTTDAASSARRVTGSSPSTYRPASSSTIDPTTASSAASVGRSASAPAASCRDSGWPCVSGATLAAVDVRGRCARAARARPRREVAQPHDAQQVAEVAPPRGGAVAAGDQDADVLGKPGHELLPQPRVEQPQALVGVDDEDDAAVVAVERVAERGEEPALGRLERAAVERHDGRATGPGVGRGGAEQRRLADAGDPVHERHDRRVALDEIQQRRPLATTPDERDKALVEHRLQRARHRAPSLRSPAVRRGGIGARRTALW